MDEVYQRNKKATKTKKQQNTLSSGRQPHHQNCSPKQLGCLEYFHSPVFKTSTFSNPFRARFSLLKRGHKKNMWQQVKHHQIFERYYLRRDTQRSASTAIRRSILCYKICGTQFKFQTRLSASEFKCDLNIKVFENTCEAIKLMSNDKLHQNSWN